MEIRPLPFTSIDWQAVPAEEHAGETGSAAWRVFRHGDLRVRIVTYEPGYLADHWCDKGHVIHVLEGEFTTELRDGRKVVSRKGMSYIVGDGSDPHRSRTETGVTLLIVD